MMERRRALTLPFTVDKNNLVSWTAFAGCKLRSRNSQHKNGSTMIHQSHAAMIHLEMKRRKPLLILPDVLKTEPGKAYIERVKMSQTMGDGGRVMSMRSDSVQSKEELLTRRDRRSSQKETRTSRSKSITPKSNQKMSPSSSQRSALRRRLQHADEDDREDSQDIEEVIIGKDSGAEDTFAEVVDCGLSLSWEPTEEAVDCHDFSPNSIKDRLSDPERDVQHRLRRKRKDSGSQCNGTGSPKRHCEGVLFHRDSVLRLTRDGEADVGVAPAYVGQEDSEDDVDLENLDNCIVQFTVGGDDETDALVPGITATLDASDFISSCRRNLSSGLDGPSRTSSSEPIVLSSDEEESGDVSQHRSQVVHRVLAVDDDSVLRRASSPESECKEQDSPDKQDAELLQVVIGEPPCSLAPSPIPDEVLSCISLSFSTLHCGGFSGRASGSLMVAKHEIIIPLKDMSEQQEGMLSFDRSELRRYSVWEQEELELRDLHFDGSESCPAGALLLFVSETAAAALQQELHLLCTKEDGAANTGEASPVVLLTLRDPLVGMEGALLRSALEIDCIKNLTLEQTAAAFSTDRHSGFLDVSSTLSMDESIELIKSSALDLNLLLMLGLMDPDPDLSADQDSSQSDADEIPTAHIWLDADLQKEPEVESEAEPEVEPEADLDSDLDADLEADVETDLEAPAEQDKGMDLISEQDQEEEELQDPPEEEKRLICHVHVPPQSKKEEAKPVYTLCHRRSKGSYSVSLSKPDSRWIKYKHQGQARRLIQFPPPPLKGGITVTMEDLQCLDGGQYLNDVIIDFYLKYLLQNASAAVAERSHIFSSFFYKQLTRRDNASEGGNNSDSCQRQRRHQRVKTWTRHVDIFKKDFLFVPVNQEAHWYLVVICFPGLDEPKLESLTGESPGQSEAGGCKSSDDHAETPQTLHRSDGATAETENTPEESTKDSPSSPVSCTEQTCQRKTVCKRPCILIMDSLKLSLHERVFKLLREYLQSEWEVRRGSSREFGSDTMKSSHCKVPLQDNSSDCGLYLLQYVECFLKDPVVHFDLPLQLRQWFPRQQVRRKRDDIRDLVLNLYRRQNLDNDRAKQLPC